MNERIEGSPVDPAAILAALPAALPFGDEPENGVGLPADHPAWQRDVISVSSRTRAVLATIAPVVVRVLTVWDHRWRELAFGARRFGVDAAGCYRLR